MDPKINPYAPGAGTRPPELAGRDDIIRECDLALTRVLAGRPARGILLTGLYNVLEKLHAGTRPGPQPDGGRSFLPRRVA